MMQRFFVSPDLLRTSDVTLDGEIAHQISRVLRMRPGDKVILLDGQGYEYKVTLVEFGKSEISGKIVGKSSGSSEPDHKVDLYLSLLNKPDKYEWALQKCTELGASRFVPVLSQNSVSGPPEEAKLARWERIIKEAAEQSGRCLLPELAPQLDLNKALKREGRRTAQSFGSSHVALMPTPEADLSLDDALSEFDEVATVSLFIGPEGGYTEEELVLAGECGVQLIDLGPRILRAETAAVAALAMVMHQLGEMGASSGPHAHHRG